MTSLSLASLPVAALLLTTSALLPAQSPEQLGWKTLRAGVGESNVARRASAVRALGLLPGVPQAVALAEHALEDEKPKVRAAAAAALGEMNSKDSIPKLRKALSDSDASVVLAAALSLVTLKDERGYEVYYAVLTGQRKTGRERASEGLRLLQDPKRLSEFGLEEGIGFIPFGGLGITAVSVLTKDDVSPVRAAAARVLANDPDPRSGEALGAAIEAKSAIVRVAAVEAIAKRGDPALVSDIEPAMSDGNDTVRYTAAAVVIRLRKLERDAGRRAASMGTASRSRAPGL